MKPTNAGHAPRKRFGQNFLQDDAVIQAIARAIGPSKEDHLVEIGPGQGALTEALVPNCGRFDAIELDRDLITTLLAAFSIYDHFTLHSDDALRFNFASLQQTENQPLRVVGNLPYNISTPLIFRLLDQQSVIKDMHFMLQLEVVQRLAATPGSKHWGRLSVMTQYVCNVSHLFDVPPDAFFPPPKVQSAIVRLVPRTAGELPAAEPKQLGRAVQLAFAQRRKTLRNNFKNVLDSDALEQLDIDPGARAETLDMAAFIRLSHALPQAPQQRTSGSAR